MKIVSLHKFFKTMTKENLTKEQKQLAHFAKALGYPVRVTILQMLAKQTCRYHSVSSNAGESAVDKEREN